MDLKIKIRIRKKKPELKIKIENRLENLSGTNRRVFQAIYIYWKALLWVLWEYFSLSRLTFQICTKL